MYDNLKSCVTILVCIWRHEICYTPYIHEVYFIIADLHINTSSFTGEIENVHDQKYALFDVGAYRFKAHPKPCVLRMCPYIRTNEEEEESAHAMLLLYVPWPEGGEENLLRGHDSAVSAFEALKKSNQLPTNVLTQIATFSKSDDILNDLGDVVHLDQNEMPEKNDDDSGESDSDVDGMNAIVDDDALSDDEKDEVDLSESVNPETLDNTGKATDVQVISSKQVKYLKKFVKNEVANYMNNYTQENSSDHVPSGNSISSSNHNKRIPLSCEEQRRQKLEERVARFTPDQRRAFDVMMQKIKGINEDSGTMEAMIQFITGGGGVGKSEYINCTAEATRLHYGKQPGTYGSVLIMGPTGGAAHNINGFTWQSVCLKGFDETSAYRHTYLTQDKAETLYQQIKGVKLIIIDEISMVSLESLYEISTRICEAICTSIADPAERRKVHKKPFAGMNTILCGDLYQLGCVGGTPIYSTYPQNMCAVRGQHIWRTIHSYHNFITSTRFAHVAGTNTSPLETFLTGARVANPSNRSMNLLNTRICLNYMDAYNKAHRNALWLCSTHQAKEPINKFMYERLQAEGAYTMDVLAKHSRNDCPPEYMTKREREKHYAKGGKVPVLLQLAIGSRVKITRNIAAQIGK